MKSSTGRICKRKCKCVVLMVRTFCFEKLSFKIKLTVDIRCCESSITVDKDPTEIGLDLFFSGRFIYKCTQL